MHYDRKSHLVKITYQNKDCGLIQHLCIQQTKQKQNISPSIILLETVWSLTLR